ncbi:MAG: phosphoribosylformylglycinamidine cyclo-ligase, partial [Clostridia bacterium]|nr:phosphoribosylformylglycinamidine cyclo-ligase [Clostridia bacterium]
MDKSYSESYRSAGVDITAGYRAVELMKEHVRSTFTPGVVTDIGGFGGLFAPDLSGITDPVLVSGTDGVGTKLKLAFMMGKWDTVGIDCVAMCVNDVICCGAKPLFFLDYIACGKNEPAKIASIVKGIADGCVESGCALIGGETAEHPGLMPEDE